MPNEPIFRISETLYIPVMVDRITQFSDAPTKYYIRLPAGIDFIISDSPIIVAVKEDGLKDIALRSVRLAIKEE